MKMTLETTIDHLRPNILDSVMGSWSRAPKKEPPWKSETRLAEMVGLVALVMPKAFWNDWRASVPPKKPVS
jgi:hypothetical protein